MALTDNLVAYWKLDETSGNRADSHGSNTLTDNNTVGSATGKIGNGADFVRANNEYLSNAGLSYGDADYSFAGWVNLETTGTFQVIFSKENKLENREYRLDFLNTTNNFNWYVFKADGGVAGGVSVSATTGWHFLSVYHNSSANEIGISMDGGTFVTASTTGTIGTTTATFRIGMRAVFDSIQDGFDGKIDEVGHWSRVLTQAEVTELYDNGRGQTYTSGIFTKQEGLYSNSFESGIGMWTTDPQITVSQSSDVAKTGTYSLKAVIANTSVTDIGRHYFSSVVDPTNATAEFWFRASVLDSGDDDVRFGFIVFNGTTEKDVSVIFKRQSTANPNREIHVFSTVAASTDDKDTNITMATNTWYRFTCTFNGASSPVAIYNASGTEMWSGTINLALADEIRGFYIQSDTGVNNCTFYIDDVFIKTPSTFTPRITWFT